MSYVQRSGSSYTTGTSIDSEGATVGLAIAGGVVWGVVASITIAVQTVGAAVTSVMGLSLGAWAVFGLMLLGALILAFLLLAGGGIIYNLVAAPYGSSYGTVSWVKGGELLTWGSGGSGWLRLLLLWLAVFFLGCSVACGIEGKWLATGCMGVLSLVTGILAVRLET